MKHQKLKKVLKEIAEDILKEMPRLKSYFVLADDWRLLARDFEEAYKGKRGEGFNNLMGGLNYLDNLGHSLITTEDLIKAWGFTGNFNLNREFRPALVKSGIIIPFKGNTLDTKLAQTTTPAAPAAPEEEDEFSFGADEDFGELTKSIDLELALKKIKIDPRAKGVTITQEKIYEKDIPGYSSVKIIKTRKWRTTVFRFIKPYVEQKYSQKVPEGLTIKLATYSWQPSEGSRKIDELFPDKKDFIQFMKDNLPVTKWWKPQPALPPYVISVRDNSTFEKKESLDQFSRYIKEPLNITGKPTSVNYTLEVTVRR
jgi:hypothetical protein